MLTSAPPRRSATWARPAASATTRPGSSPAVQRDVPAHRAWRGQVDDVDAIAIGIGGDRRVAVGEDAQRAAADRGRRDGRADRRARTAAETARRTPPIVGIPPGRRVAVDARLTRGGPHSGLGGTGADVTAAAGRRPGAGFREQPLRSTASRRREKRSRTCDRGGESSLGIFSFGILCQEVPCPLRNWSPNALIYHCECASAANQATTVPRVHSRAAGTESRG